MRLIGWLILSSTLMISSSYAQVWRTLPKGVRLFEYRNVNTTKIDAAYNQSQAVTPLSYDINANAKTLESVGSAAALYFEQLRAINPQAYDQLTFGEFNLSAEAQVQVNGFGGGFGINDKLTVYGIVPYYTATVNMKYQQKQASNAQQVADQVQQSGQGDIDSTLSNITGALPGATGNLLQSVVVNTFKYDEIGTWQGQGYGDIELGTVYRLIDEGTWGVALTGGVVAPTGREDDPDLLQDIGFGDGQWDGFAEGATGYLFTDKFSMGTTFRYTYQAPATKTLRVPMSRDFQLSDQSGSFNVKYGDKINYSLSATYSFNDWFSLTPSYLLNYQMSSRYDSVYGDANEYLAYNSDRVEHVARMTATLSSIQPFLKKKFILPASVYVNVQQTVAGRNVPKVGRFELGLRMLF
ncbi:MAG: transporter [Bacteriovoracaceae bacterium]|nr:transporter [Bacteriovoracaceae bacterium]